MSAAIARLISRLDVAGDRAAEKVIRAIARHGRKAVPLLLEAAQDRAKPRVRKWSLEALGAIPDPRSLSVLEEALRAPEMTVRLHSLKALRRLRAKRAAASIRKLLKDPSGGIRLNAIYALIDLEDSRAAIGLCHALRDREWYVRQNAAIACGIFGIRGAALPLARLAAKDPRKAVREAAKSALGKLGK